MKQCRKCNELKNESEFGKEKRNKDGLYSYCNKCKTEMSKRWNQANPEKVKSIKQKWNTSEVGKYANIEWKRQNPEKARAIQRRAKLKARYGISEEQYIKMLEEQNHSCAICGKHESQNVVGNKTIKLAVDHCHDTKDVRGLLCDRCNTSIGKFEHSVELLQKAISYLKK